MSDIDRHLPQIEAWLLDKSIPEAEKAKKSGYNKGSLRRLRSTVRQEGRSALLRQSLDRILNLAAASGWPMAASPLAPGPRPDEMARRTGWAPITNEERRQLKENNMGCERILTYADRCLTGSFLPDEMRDWEDRRSLARQNLQPDEIERHVRQNHVSSKEWFKRRKKAKFFNTFLVCEEDFREAAKVDRGWMYGVGERAYALRHSLGLAIASPEVWAAAKRTITKAALGFPWHAIVIYDEKEAVVQLACRGQWLLLSDRKEVRTLCAAVATAVSETRPSFDRTEEVLKKLALRPLCDGK